MSAARWRRRKALALWRRLWRDGALAVTLACGPPEAERRFAVTVMLDGDVVLSLPRGFGGAQDEAMHALLLRLLQGRVAALAEAEFGALPARARGWVGGAVAAHGVAVPAWHLGVAWQWAGEAGAALGAGAALPWPPAVLAWPLLALAAPPLLLLAGRHMGARAARRLLAG